MILRRRRLGSPGPHRLPHQPEPHEVAATQRNTDVRQPLLRHVPDVTVATPQRLPQKGRFTGRQTELAQDRTQQTGLSRTIGAQHRDELTRLHVQIQIAPQHSPAQGERRAAHPEYRILIGELPEVPGQYRSARRGFACGASSRTLGVAGKGRRDRAH